MLDLVLITCFIIVVTVIWVSTSFVKTAKKIRNDLNGIGSVLINISEDIDNLYNSIEDPVIYGGDNLTSAGASQYAITRNASIA